MFAGDHEVVSEGISAYPQEVTGLMVKNLLNGGAGINVLARSAGANVSIIDIGMKEDIPNAQGLIKKNVGRAAHNITKGPAMTVEEAEKIALEYQRIFGEDFYLELMRHRTDDAGMNKLVFDDQVFVNRTLLELGRKLGIKCVASNDAHFVNMEDAEAHDHLICLNTGKDLDDPTRMRYTRQEWFKTQAEMKEVFSDLPAVLNNTIEVADKVERYELDANPVMPYFPLPEGFSNEDEYLKHITCEGAAKRYPEITEEVRERIDFELGTIQRGEHQVTIINSGGTVEAILQGKEEIACGLMELIAAKMKGGR